MKLTNFHIHSGGFLLFSGQSLDLHNDFDFEGFRCDGAPGDLVLSWQQAQGDWVRPTLPRSIHVTFRRVSLVRFRPRSKKHESDGSRTVSFIGFLHPDQEEHMDGCVDENEADEQFHFILGFEDGSALKVYADEVACRVA